jgi:hypothetical protein
VFIVDNNNSLGEN